MCCLITALLVNNVFDDLSGVYKEIIGTGHNCLQFLCKTTLFGYTSKAMVIDTSHFSENKIAKPSFLMVLH